MRTIDGIEVEVYELSFPFTLFAAGMGYKKVRLKDPLKASDRLIRHELCHTQQGLIISKYIYWWFRRGYKNNPFEIEAYELQKYARGWKQVEKRSYSKYK